MPFAHNGGWNRPEVSTALVKGYNGCLPRGTAAVGGSSPSRRIFFSCPSRQFHYREFIPKDWSKELR